MAGQWKNYEDLAEKVQSWLRAKRINMHIARLKEVLAVLFYASLRTEEGQSIRCQVVWIDPDNPEPNPPDPPQLDRWQYVPLSESLPFEEDNIVKLALATDERSSALAIFISDGDHSVIHGLIDQGAVYHRATVFDAAPSGPRPGVFYASIVGPGRLIVGKDTVRIAELRVSELVTRDNDVVMGGEVRSRLEQGITQFIESAQQEAARLRLSQNSERDKKLEEKWARSLCRILYRMRGFGHGGALLITPNESFDNLDRNLDRRYEITYDRLKTSLLNWAKCIIRLEAATNAVNHQIKARRPVKRATINREREYSDQLAEAENEIDGAIWQIALLSRVDGLVLLTPDLTVHGYGVKIKVNTELSNVRRARYRTTTSTDSFDYARLGMRHQSMMKYCKVVEGSVGFVVSQDGDVRAITKVGDDVVVWDNVRLTLDEYARWIIRLRLKRE